MARSSEVGFDCPCCGKRLRLCGMLIAPNETEDGTVPGWPDGGPGVPKKVTVRRSLPTKILRVKIPADPWRRIDMRDVAPFSAEAEGRRKRWREQKRAQRARGR